jgi:hypothetical protein
MIPPPRYLLRAGRFGLSTAVIKPPVAAFLVEFPQLAAPTFLHLESAPEPYALGQTLYRLFTL